MKWTKRFAVRAVFGILISGAMLTGCSNNQAVDEGNSAAAGASKGAGPTDSAGNPIKPTNP